MTPTWNISDPGTDFIAKPAVRESFSGKTLLDLVLDNLRKSGMARRVLVRVGDRPDLIAKERSQFIREMKTKAREDVLRIVSARRGVTSFHNNPDGADEGTGATIVSREAKSIIAEDGGVSNVLLVASDLPTIPPRSIAELVRLHNREHNDVTVSMVVERDPSGHGRVVRYPLMFLGIHEGARTGPDTRGGTSGDLNARLVRGEIAVVRLPGARVPPKAPWAEYLVLQHDELEAIRRDGSVQVFHPLRGVVPGDMVKVDEALIISSRIDLRRGGGSVWDERSGHFLAIVEQSQIGDSAERRREISEVRVEGFEEPFSTDFLHSIRQRNVLCMVVTKRVFQRTIRDLDAPNYGRIVGLEGKQVIVANDLISRPDARIISVDGLQVDADLARSSISCVRLNGDAKGHYVLERHPGGEYYLPEVANKVAASAGRVGVFELPEGSAEGIDTRTDLRKLSGKMMNEYEHSLESQGVDVSSLSSFMISSGFSAKGIGRGTQLRGFVHLSGSVKLGTRASVEDSSVEGTPSRPTRVHSGARVIRSIVRNSVIGAGTVVEGSFLENARVPNGSVIKNERVVGKSRTSGETLYPSETEGSSSGLAEVNERELQVIEQLYGVTVHPGSRVHLDSGTRKLLSGLGEAMDVAGGSKQFISTGGEHLLRGALGLAAGNDSLSGVEFRLGPNAELAFRVVLCGPIDVGSGSVLENSVVKGSEIGKAALLRGATVENSRVESSPDKPSIVEGICVSRQVLERGYPHVMFLDVEPQLSPIKEWKRYFSSAGSERLLESFYGKDPQLCENRRKNILHLLDCAADSLGEDSAVIVVRIPGRVNLMGRHIDHRGGFVNSIAIPREVLLVARPRENDVVSVTNIDREYAAFSFSLRKDGPKRRIATIDEWRDWTQADLEERRGKGVGPDWSEYCRSSVYLQNHYLRKDGSAFRELRGADMVLSGDIPLSVGLSSSSAIVVGTFLALSALNSLEMSEERLIELCGDGEWFVGTRGGCGDHAAMVWAKRGKVCRIGFFPLSVSWANAPARLRTVICSSMVQARKISSAKDKFNEKVATYELASMLFLSRYPRFAPFLKRFRDMNPSTLGVDLSEFYRMLKALPVRATRAELLRALSTRKEDLEKLFREHKEPPEGYGIRGVALFGISECNRSRIACSVLSKHPEKFGLLMKISHNGDREVVHHKEGQERWVVPLDDAYLDTLARESRHGARGGTGLSMQSGYYGCGHERTDMLVDLALTVKGVLGAQLVGAGLGGCVVVLVREGSVNNLLNKLADSFYPSADSMKESVIVCVPAAGASVFRVPDRSETTVR